MEEAGTPGQVTQPRLLWQQVKVNIFPRRAFSRNDLSNPLTTTSCPSVPFHREDIFPPRTSSSFVPEGKDCHSPLATLWPSSPTPGASFETQLCHRPASLWKSSHPQAQGVFLGERKPRSFEKPMNAKDSL